MSTRREADKKSHVKTDLDEAFIGTCENCHKENTKVRRIHSAGDSFGGASRGYFNICYKCIKPKITFRGRDGRTYEAPMNLTEEELDALLGE